MSQPPVRHFRGFLFLERNGVVSSLVFIVFFVLTSVEGLLFFGGE